MWSSLLYSQTGYTPDPSAMELTINQRIMPKSTQNTSHGWSTLYVILLQTSTSDVGLNIVTSLITHVAQLFTSHTPPVIITQKILSKTLSLTLHVIRNMSFLIATTLDGQTMEASLRSCLSAPYRHLPTVVCLFQKYEWPFITMVVLISYYPL